MEILKAWGSHYFVVGVFEPMVVMVGAVFGDGDDGVGDIMVGGGDISECKNNKINRLRDKLDLKLYKYLKLNKVKVISICRSSQLLLTKIYKFKIFKNNNHVRCNHIIINNKLKLNVNSYHNYSLMGDLSKFQEYFIHKDGSIEIGVDSIKNNLILMFHPERQNINQKKINSKILKFINL